MKVLVIGGGGREHAIAWRCSRSATVDEVLVAPGNAGTLREPGLRNVDVAADDIDGLLALARSEAIALTIVGPEQPLVAGICDRFADAGLACFGPSAAAAQLEGSKAFSKAFLERHGIPTARYAAFSDFASAADYIRAQTLPLVIKADGLAAGKGVVIAETHEAALAAAKSMLDEGRFGSAGSEIVVEEFLTGEEASFIVMADGETLLPMASSQDHKARDDGDRGPNTGGMGAYSPAPVVTPAVADHVMRDIMQPTLAALAADGIRYVGFLYAGLMIDGQGRAKVLEFNCRLGDPETQPLMLRLDDDLPALCLAALDSQLAGRTLNWDPRPALGVVLAAGGYPDRYRKGHAIRGIEAAEADHDIKVFHAGTAMRDGTLVTSGGRVLCVTALGNDLAAAREAAYRGVDQIDWDGVFCRRDIGHRALKPRD